MSTTLRSAIITRGFRTMHVTISHREYQTENLTPSSQCRLLAVLNSVPASNRSVELESDFTPTVYLYFYKQVHTPESTSAIVPAYNLPKYTGECPERTATYLRLMEKGVSEFTDDDRAAFASATGRCVQPLPPVTRETWTLPANPTYQDIVRRW